MTALLHDLVTSQAQRRPDRTAVEFGSDSITFGRLEAESNQLGGLLRHLGCRHGDRVAMLMPKGIPAIIAMLGSLKADAAYVPLDPAGPAPRLAHMLEASECRCIVAAGRTRELLQETLARARLRHLPRIVWLDPDIEWDGDLILAATARNLRAFSPDPLPTNGRDADVAHVLFTSGSTGTPKGVMVTHRSVLRFLDWAWSYFGISARDRLSQHAPLHFDLSTFDIYGALGAGACLCLVPPTINLLPHKLAQFMRESRLTQWFSVPSVLTLMAKHGVVAPRDLPDLRRVIWCGEVIPTPTLIYWMRRLRSARFTNLYGPTEATIASSHYTVAQCPANETETIPIGSACDGEELLILDERMQPVRDGDVGELYIAGAGLSPGYLNDATKTESAFRPRPSGKSLDDRIYRTGDLARRGADGLFYFIGRADTQIKSRGYRIELGEIESALYTLPQVGHVAVVAVESDGFENWTICCAYVPRSNAIVVDSTGLRRELARLLPAYMLPSRWLKLDALPVNGNGKVDRRELKKRFRQLDADAAPNQPGETAALARGV
jgi:amino acid adenylation domain-containing protein